MEYRNATFRWTDGRTDGQTDRRTYGQTDRIAISISRVNMLTGNKNWLEFKHWIQLSHVIFTIEMVAARPVARKMPVGVWLCHGMHWIIITPASIISSYKNSSVLMFPGSSSLNISANLAKWHSSSTNELSRSFGYESTSVLAAVSSSSVNSVNRQPKQLNWPAIL